MESIAFDFCFQWNQFLSDCAFLIRVSDIKTFQFFWILTYTLFCFPVPYIFWMLFCFLALSAESVEEIMQLFGNYHQLSEILKEKANTAGMILPVFTNWILLFWTTINIFILLQWSTCTYIITHDRVPNVCLSKCVTYRMQEIHCSHCPPDLLFAVLIEIMLQCN